MPKLTKDKKELSIALSNELLDYIKQNHKNRSKFIQECIINELNKYEKYKNMMK